jgi:tRNA pseudouridine55 synthase
LMSDPIEGLICLDKPSGQSSHDAINAVRRLAGIRRIGHAGTLDPLASGLLLVCLGRATRLLEYSVGQPKTYLAKIQLGRATNTYDAEGEVTAEHAVEISRQRLLAALDKFRGVIEQLAPMYSAVKVGGQPLYRLARKGESVERPARNVTIHELDLLAWRDSLLALRIHCSSGTYIRSIAHDLGQELGCGAFLAGLRRTEVGRFSLADAASLAALDQDNWRSYLRPADSAAGHLAHLDVTGDEALTLYHGQAIQRRPGQREESLVRAYDEGGLFVGVLAADGQQWRPQKIFYRPDQG